MDKSELRSMVVEVAMSAFEEGAGSRPDFWLLHTITLRVVMAALDGREVPHEYTSDDSLCDLHSRTQRLARQLGLFLPAKAVA